MTTLALTCPDVAPAIQRAPSLEIIRRGLTWLFICTGILLTFMIIKERGPVMYGIPVPLARQMKRQSES